MERFFSLRSNRSKCASYTQFFMGFPMILFPFGQIFKDEENENCPRTFCPWRFGTWYYFFTIKGKPTECFIRYESLLDSNAKYTFKPMFHLNMNQWETFFKCPRTFCHTCTLLFFFFFVWRAFFLFYKEDRLILA